MQIELLTSRVGVKGAQNRGDIIEVSDAEAKRMIEAGQAIPVRTVAAPEKAVRKTKG